MNKVTEQTECRHAYGDWKWVDETHNDTDFYERVCQHCKHVDTHSGKMPPVGYKEPLKPTNLLRGKLQFLVALTDLIGSRGFGSHVVYIAGKVTGLPPAEVHFKLYKKQIELEKKGFTVLNPCQFIAIDAEWGRAMRMASTLLMMSDFICLLPDWDDSKGAKMEFEMAVQMGISVMDAA